MCESTGSYVVISHRLLTASRSPTRGTDAESSDVDLLVDLSGGRRDRRIVGLGRESEIRYTDTNASFSQRLESLTSCSTEQPLRRSQWGHGASRPSDMQSGLSSTQCEQKRETESPWVRCRSLQATPGASALLS